MSILTDFFNRLIPSTRYFPYGKRPPANPFHTDETGGFKADSKTLDSIWHGENNAYNLAQGLVYTPIARPCQLIGIPQPVASDPATQKAADEIRDHMKDEFADMEQTKQVHGTQWRFPRWDSKVGGLVWEYINDDSVERIEQDVISNELTGIWTHDYFTVADGRTNTQNLERIRHFTRQRIDVQWVTKGTSTVLKDYSQRNVFGWLPRPNGHATNSGKWRGYSVIAPQMRLIKTYHDVLRNACQILSEFEPKWVQTVGHVGTWLENNAFDIKNGIVEASEQAYSSHFQINLPEEKTEYMFMPSGAMDQYETILKRVRTEAIAGGPVPEIFYGTLATGNEASVADHRQMIVSYVQSLRRENEKFYTDMYNRSLQIRSTVENRNYGEVTVSYSRLDLLSETEQAEVLLKTAQGIGAIVEHASATTDDIYYIWKGLYPELPEKDVKEFTKGIKVMTAHKASLNADPELLTDMANA
jgi:hypothetical protein